MEPLNTLAKEVLANPAVIKDKAMGWPGDFGGLQSVTISDETSNEILDELLSRNLVSRITTESVRECRMTDLGKKEFMRLKHRNTPGDTPRA